MSAIEEHRPIVSSLSPISFIIRNVLLQEMLDNSWTGKHVLPAGRAIHSKNIGDNQDSVVYGDSERKAWNSKL
jgi:hypothetical protein